MFCQPSNIFFIHYVYSGKTTVYNASTEELSAITVNLLESSKTMLKKSVETISQVNNIQNGQNQIIKKTISVSENIDKCIDEEN